MSKVNNIKKHLLPFLTKVLDTRLSNVSNLWFEDIRNNLFKLNIFEDGYMISSNSDYPENADKNFYNNVNIYSYPSYLTNTTLDNLVNIIYEDKKVVNIIYDIKNT